MSRTQFDELKAEGESVTRAIAALMDRASEDPEIQTLIARHQAWVDQFYHTLADLYRGLGLPYTEHGEFKAY